MPIIRVLVVRKNEAGKGLLDQIASCHAQQPGRREIGFQDQPLFAERKITHRREIEEVEIPRPRGFQFILCPPQFLVLHLQLDLMHAKFVEQTSGFFGRSYFAELRLGEAELLHGPPPQAGEIVGIGLILSHGPAPCLGNWGGAAWCWCVSRSVVAMSYRENHMRIGRSISVASRK